MLVLGSGILYVIMLSREIRFGLIGSFVFVGNVLSIGMQFLVVRRS